MQALKHLRQQFRGARRQMPETLRQQAQQQISTRLLSFDLFQSAQWVAGYLANDGEYDPAIFLAQARVEGKVTLLPQVIAPGQPMQFAPYDANTPMNPNRFGIPEPDIPPDQIVPPDQLDIVLMPLVAFDEHGTRLGMGGGFYDRSFAFKRASHENTRPLLIGVAFEQQKSEQDLPAREWDVRLDVVVTEACFYQWPQKHS